MVAWLNHSDIDMYWRSLAGELVAQIADEVLPENGGKWLAKTKWTEEQEQMGVPSSRMGQFQYLLLAGRATTCPP